MTKYDDIEYHLQSVADGDFTQESLENYYASLIAALHELGYLEPEVFQRTEQRHRLESGDISPSEIISIVDGKLDSGMFTNQGNEVLANYDQIAGAYWDAAEDGEFDAADLTSCRAVARAIVAKFASPTLTPFR